MVKASISLPRSCMMSFLKNRDIGSSFESRMHIAAANESAESACPARKIIPKMVEYQSGESDMTQSKEAKVMLRQKRISPGALSFWNFSRHWRPLPGETF